jgi:hypothetical protein
MKRIGIKYLFIFVFLFTGVLSFLMTIGQEYFWLRKNEVEKIKEYNLPATVALGRVIESFIKNKIELLGQVGREISKTGISNGCNFEILKSVLFRNTDILGIGIVDFRGKLVYYSPEIHKKNIDELSVFFRERNSLEPQVGDIVVEEKKVFIPIKVPLITTKTNIRGYIFCEYDVNAIRNIIWNYSPIENIRITLVDRKGRVISTPFFEKLEMENADFSATDIYKEAMKKEKGMAYFVSMKDGKKNWEAITELLWDGLYGLLLILI